MSFSMVYRAVAVCLMVLALQHPSFSYDGSGAWLLYNTVSNSAVKAGYVDVCKNVVLSNAASDTLKIAKAELDLALPTMIAVTLTSATSASAGSIVLAPQGSALIPGSISYAAVKEGGFIIKTVAGATYITGKSEVAVIYGTFHFIKLMQMGSSISNLDVLENPYFPWRVADFWYNHYGTSGGRSDVERIYPATPGRLFKLENLASFNTNGDRTRVINMCRLFVSQGINGMCPDNVNTYKDGELNNWKIISSANLTTQKPMCDLIGLYGIKYFMSVSYANPRLEGGLSTADATLATVQAYWSARVDDIKAKISNFAGFLMKADSEGEAGPGTYNKGPADGANPMALALKKYGYHLIWRTFVYGANDPDPMKCPYLEFNNEVFDAAIVLRPKDGNRDFQVHESPPTVIAMNPISVRKGMELQVTQEYTGQDVHLCWLYPKWQETMDFDYKVTATLPAGYAGTQCKQLMRGTGETATGGGLWAIHNFSSVANWTGHFLAQANSYAFGSLAWNPALSQDQVAEEWIARSFANGRNPKIQFVVKDMLARSWQTYEDYTGALGLLMPAGSDHFAPDFEKRNTAYYLNFKSDGCGVDRTSATGNKMVSQYPAAVASTLESRSTCPDKWILHFHHVPYTFKLKEGMTVAQKQLWGHLRGPRIVQKWIDNWKLIQSEIDPAIYSHVSTKLSENLSEANKWKTSFISFINGFYSAAVPSDVVITSAGFTGAVWVKDPIAINLSAVAKDQKGATVSQTISWSSENGGTFSAAQGASTVFTPPAGSGIYTLRATTPDNIYDYIHIFVGDWGQTSVAAGSKAAIQPAMKITRSRNGVYFSVPSKGTVEIVKANGVVVKSFAGAAAAEHFWNTRGTARGMYLAHFKSNGQNAYGRIFVR